MPTRKPNETHDDFISRCIPIVIDDGTAKSNDQAVAVCESLWKGEGMSRKLRLLRSSLPQVSLQTSTFEGNEYTVVPVVALVGDTVVHSSTSRTPELIPESVLNIAPSSWDGRPVIYSHPQGQESANTPQNLEKKIGYIFNTKFEDGKLKMEAWLREDLADNAGASELFQRLQNGDPIEVSVGSWTLVQQYSGELNGEHYDGVWSVAIPDHLAFLPPGVLGACNIDMGCGAPRLNEANAVEVPWDTQSNSALLNWLNKEASLQMWAANTPATERPISIHVVNRLLARVGLGPDGVSHGELHVTLFDELAKLDPEFDFYIEDIYQGESNSVIYAAFNGEDSVLRRRKFTIEGTNLTLDSSFEDTYRVVTYVAASSTTGRDAQGDPDMSADKIQPLVERLVAHEASPFTEAHVEQLSSFDEATLETMLTRCGEYVEPVKVDKPVKPEKLEKLEKSEGDDKADEPQPVHLTEEQWMEAAPAHVRAMVAKYERKEKEERTALLSKLAKVQTTFTREELDSKSTDELEKLAAFIDEAVNYEGRLLEAEDPVEVDTIPDPWGIRKAS